MTQLLEKDIEKALSNRVKRLGGMCEKFKSVNKISVPDRIVTLPGGRIIFVELKRPGMNATRAQARDHKRRRELGCVVRVINSLKQVAVFPDEV